MAKRKATIIAPNSEVREISDNLFMRVLQKLQDDGVISIEGELSKENCNELLERFTGQVSEAYADKTPEEIQQEIDRLQQKLRDKTSANAAPTTTYPDKYIMPLANAVTSLASVSAPLTRDALAAQKLSVGGDVSVYVSLGLDSDTAKENGITIPGRITDFDLEVLNAVVSLLKAGNRLFWPEQIASVLKGKKAIATTHDEEINRIVTAIERLRFTAVYIDATEQFANHRYKTDPDRVQDQHGVKHVVYDENILYLRGARAVTLQNGKTVTAWEYAGNRMPVLYEYSDRLNQITKVDIHLLDTGIRSDETMTVAKTYMLREISKMKRGSRNNNKMLFSTILKACGIDQPENDSEKAKDAFRKRKTRFTTDYFVKFCESWKAQNFISDYKILPDGIRFEL